MEFRHHANATLIFGAGSISTVPDALGRGPVFIVAGRHVVHSTAWSVLERGLRQGGIDYRYETVHGEPSPEVVDALVDEARDHATAHVVAIGGGSVLDAGKAVAAMLCHEGGVFDYLEGVGTRKPDGRTLPLIAVPTTAGTGSEATKNAVIGRRGAHGFKKSLRHDAFVPPLAVIDPALAVGCPPEVTIACGMDAFCQLLESFVSSAATPVTDALARDGLARFGHGKRLFVDQRYGTTDEIDDRAQLALAAYYSGLTLANAGLGTVHGLAGPLGAACDVPHGVACGLLLEPVYRRVARRLSEAEHTTAARVALDRLAHAGALVARGTAAEPRAADLDALLGTCRAWADRLPRLSTYGLAERDIAAVVAASGNKTSPAALTPAEMTAALRDVW